MFTPPTPPPTRGCVLTFVGPGCFLLHGPFSKAQYSKSDLMTFLAQSWIYCYYIAKSSPWPKRSLYFSDLKKWKVSWAPKSSQGPGHGAWWRGPPSPRSRPGSELPTADKVVQPWVGPEAPVIESHESHTPSQGTVRSDFPLERRKYQIYRKGNEMFPTTQCPLLTEDKWAFTQIKHKQKQKQKTHLSICYKVVIFLKMFLNLSYKIHNTTYSQTLDILLISDEWWQIVLEKNQGFPPLFLCYCSIVNTNFE